MKVKGKNATFVTTEEVEHYLSELAYKHRMNKSEYLRQLIEREAKKENIKE